MSNNKRLFENGEFIVKHIRKPRKGSAEARDIVAMLARDKHQSLIGMLHHYTDSNQNGCWEKRKIDNNRWDCGGHYKKAKSMLK